MATYLQLVTSGWDGFCFDVSLRATAVLAAAWATASVLAGRRSSAAWRHAVWSLSLVSVLVLPILAAILPAWRVPSPWRQAAVASRMADTPSEEPGSMISLLASMKAAQPMTPVLEQQAGSAQADGKRANDTIATPAPIGGIAAGIAGPAWLLGVWIGGILLAIAPLCLAVISLRRLVRSSHLVTEGTLHDALRQVSGQADVKGSVRLLISSSRAMPMTWGLWRPTILLPAEADRWPSDRLRIVLRHELAHIERRDCLTRVLAQIVRAIYWFHPIVWVAERRLRIEQEQACDDIVLNSGFAAPDYAEHLLAVSAACRLPASAAAMALAMARVSKIEQRLTVILRSRQNRSPVSFGRLAIAAGVAVALLSPLSTLRFTTAAEQQGKSAGKADTAPGERASERAKALSDLRAEIAQQYVLPVDEATISQGAIKGMIESLNDRYSGFLTPEMLADMEKQLGGKLVGIGAQLEMHGKQIRVVTPLDDSPALKAGIQPGDVILQIDDQPAAGLELAEAVKRIAGTQGTAVRLRISRGGQELDVAVTRRAIKVPTIKGFRRGSDNHWDFLLDAGRKVGYVSISYFAAATPQEMQEVIGGLKRQGVQGLIVDLRSSPGGMLEAAVAVAKQFLAGGTIVSLHSRDGEVKSLKADGPDALGGLPIAVLINGQTASAAEILAGALQDNQRAVLLGTRTIGKGSVQTLIKLDEGQGAIKLTTARYRTPSGRDIDRQTGEKSWGINPDEGYFVAVSRDQARALHERRQEREIIGTKSDRRAKSNGEITPQWIEAEQSDPQLAAALTTLTARLTTGRFAKVGEASAAQIEKALKTEEVEHRRESVLKNLEQLNRELAELEREAPAGN